MVRRKRAGRSPRLPPLSPPPPSTVLPVTLLSSCSCSSRRLCISSASSSTSSSPLLDAFCLRHSVSGRVEGYQIEQILEERSYSSPYFKGSSVWNWDLCVSLSNPGGFQSPLRVWGVPSDSAVEKAYSLLLGRWGWRFCSVKERQSGPCAQVRGSPREGSFWVPKGLDSHQTASSSPLPLGWPCSSSGSILIQPNKTSDGFSIFPMDQH